MRVVGLSFLLLLAAGCGGNDTSPSQSPSIHSEPATPPAPASAPEPPPTPQARTAPLPPPENLAPWPRGSELPGDDGLSVVAAIDDGPLVLLSFEHFVLLHGDPETPTRVLPNPEHYYAVTMNQPYPFDTVAADPLALHVVGGIVGLSLDTMARRWSLEAPEHGSFSVLSAGDTFVLEGPRSLLGVDPTSGETLWERPAVWAPIRLVTNPPYAAARGVVVMILGNTLEALDARTGEVRWTAPATDAARLFGPDEDRLGVLDEETVRILDLDDGSVLATVPYPHRIGPAFSLALDAERLYALDYERHDASAVVRAVAWRSGEADWTSEPIALEPLYADLPFLRIDDGAVIVCVPQVATRVLSPTTGGVLWRDRSTGCLPPTWRPRPGAARILFLASENGPVPYARAATPPPTRELSLSGTVVCDGRPAANARVLVGDEEMRADARGRFRATVQTTGPVRVATSNEGIGPMGCFGSTVRVVSASGQMRLELPVMSEGDLSGL